MAPRVAGGNPPMRRDQLLQPTSRAGVGPAPQSNVIVARLVYIIGPGGGLFVYSPTAAFGNLIASITAQSGNTKDTFGNAVYGPGFTVYVPGTPAYALNMNGDALSWLTSAGGVGGPYTGGVLNTLALVPGQGLQMTSPSVTLAANSAVIPAPTLTMPANGQCTLNDAILSIVSNIAPAGTAALTVTGFTAQRVAELIADAAATNALGIMVSGDTNSRVNWSAAGQIGWGSGAAPPDSFLQRVSANLLGVTSADFTCHTTGRGLRVAEGSNAKQGTGTLAAGTATIANTSVTANSKILCTGQPGGANRGGLNVTTITPATSFVVTSTNGADTGNFAYEIFEPG